MSGSSEHSAEWKREGGSCWRWLPGITALQMQAALGFVALVTLRNISAACLNRSSTPVEDEEHSGEHSYQNLLFWAHSPRRWLQHGLQPFHLAHLAPQVTGRDCQWGSTHNIQLGLYIMQEGELPHRQRRQLAPELGAPYLSVPPLGLYHQLPGCGVTAASSKTWYEEIPALLQVTALMYK